MFFLGRVSIDRVLVARCNVAMLGHLRRTSRLDVGFALAFAGLAYLVWALVAGASRFLVQRLMLAQGVYQLGDADLPTATRLVKWIFVDYGFGIDAAGLAWLILSLVLVFLSSRQTISDCWAWVSSMCQGLVSALGAMAVGKAVYAPHDILMASNGLPEGASLGEKVSSLSLAIIIPLAILAWVTALVLLLTERARLNRHGPTLHDGLRTQGYR